MATYIMQTLSEGWSVCKFYIFWMLVHFACANLYAHFCAHISILGFLTSPFLMNAPHCTGLRWVVNTGASSVQIMWFAIASWFGNKLFRPTKRNLAPSREHAD